MYMCVMYMYTFRFSGQRKGGYFTWGDHRCIATKNRGDFDFMDL